ncbi:hypothetical protein N6B72_08050 [Chryseobacterium soli]|uniref:Uncharacterized protein n=1 Tax=Chryseobacterium soli TaxID=445961 RepID=A0A086ABQ8_9FLAO|nr:hypothetical protein [Chryseobacterium soli]KFF14122.1 hypothetical protein IW15_01370 [Chryseobacterium soli]MDV7696869.1 hypothetical protein [Chryseobacterium soli]
MAQEEMDFLLLSIQDYKKNGFYNSKIAPKGYYCRLRDYQNNPEWNEFDFKKEVFEELLGEDFGKHDFYYEPNTWEFIVQAIEKKIREVLKMKKKVPKEHTQNPMEYLKTYKSKNFDTDPAIFHEDVREFLGELYHYNLRKNSGDSNLNYLQMFYNTLKKNYEEGYPLYISVATIEDQKKYP